MIFYKVNALIHSKILTSLFIKKNYGYDKKNLTSLGDTEIKFFTNTYTPFLYSYVLYSLIWN